MTPNSKSMVVRLFVVLAVLLAQGGALAADAGGIFPAVKAKTFSKQKFNFPASLSGTRLNVLFLAMSDEQDNGQYQQEALLDWQAALNERDVFSKEVVAYHFPVLKSPPFFVKGIIRSAMRDAYEGKVPLDQAAILFVDDLPAFAGGAALELDKRPTIVIASADGRPLHSIKGEVSPDGVDALVAAIQMRARDE